MESIGFQNIDQNSMQVIGTKRGSVSWRLINRKMFIRSETSLLDKSEQFKRVHWYVYKGDIKPKCTYT